jgi:surfeit locus 1 family protein
VGLRTLGDDTSAIHYRRVVVAGRPDYDRELLLTNRSLRGSPGVNFITPVRVEGSDTAILVNRGWAYAPDGMTVDRNAWRDADTVFVGHVEAMIAGRDSSTRQGTIRRMQLEEIRRHLPYPVRPYYVVDGADSAVPSRQDRVVPIGAPALDEGSHFSYAMQWFGFAAVALVGGVIATVRRLRPTRAQTMHEPVTGTGGKVHS